MFTILLYYFYKKKENELIGKISGLFLLLYSFFRFSIEYLREPDAHLGLFLGYFSMGQLLSVPLFIFGILIFVKK